MAPARVSGRPLSVLTDRRRWIKRRQRAGKRRGRPAGDGICALCALFAEATQPVRRQIGHGASGARASLIVTVCVQSPDNVRVGAVGGRPDLPPTLVGSSRGRAERSGESPGPDLPRTLISQDDNTVLSCEKVRKKSGWPTQKSGRALYEPDIPRTFSGLFGVVGPAKVRARTFPGLSPDLPPVSYTHLTLPTKA